MRIRHLRYFLVVAEEQSFARAAARVHIEASPLSRVIKEMESQLGVQLFHRNNGRIKLTWPGEVFLEEARRILCFMDNAQSRVQSASQGFRGRLRIGLTDSLAQPRLANLLARCREEEPRTEVRITEMTVSEMMHALSHDQIDVGLTVDNTEVPGFFKEAVWAERPAIAVPARHPLLALDTVPVSQVLRYPLLLCHPERCAGGYNVIRRWFTDPSLPVPNVAEYVSGHEPMIMLVAAGYGIAICLDSQIALFNHPDVVVRPVAREVPDTSTFMVTAQKERSPELTRFIQRALIVGEAPYSSASRATIA
ncbi:TPA: LysR family transcriptional regulator [Pseudomonas aeruginosa]|uniref:LysR family transcriptional regulator n=1 Tax=Pseudomonas aeruginosa group TaxID=136841 RepID=UPI0012D8783B|nr:MULTISPECIES: LysR substrate-binding domain-containing protein [Pseudomonas aeruginosa group]MBH9459219.1 LysR family transcriptional regulator [Pseudomonas aeruginosa]MBH9465940.1 LysR family transcriptional regulator [Pseudomonas aeruginosa]MUI47025.1 LysR family transcriptional regulator [Pseudomonas aeruginosa]QPZ62119.1 LysR family transcriptional regulator [Pseudomonas aeruginosa]HCF0987714.1 LysR family transcriptional regulator [Pseudomonas aeruginosa]